MTPPPHPAPRYVVAWRDHSPSSSSPLARSRLRTYSVASNSSPLSFPLEDLIPTPPPERVIDTEAALQAFLESDSTDAVAVLDSVAASYLGWDPAPPTPPEPA